MLTTSQGSLHLIFTTVPWGKYYSICPILQMSRLGLFFSIYVLFVSFSPSSSFQILSSFEPLFIHVLSSFYKGCIILLLSPLQHASPPPSYSSLPLPLGEPLSLLSRICYVSIVWGQNKDCEPST